MLACALLGLAVVALWVPGALLKRPIWQWFTAAALLAGCVGGVIDGRGVGVACGWFALLYIWAADFAAPKWRRGVEAAVVVAAAAALMMHALPGFANPRVIDGVRFTPEAMPFSLYVNFDKTLIALGVLGLAHPRVAAAREWRELIAATWWRAALTITVVLAASLALGYVRWAPKLPAETSLWLAVNLLFVGTAEEALFHGFIQGGLRRVGRNWRGGNGAALAVAAVLFGVAHAAGGWKYIALATVAGAGYGWVYERTQRVEASVLAHCALNTLHFFFFTYPALAR